MKRNISEQTVTCEGFRLQYTLLTENGTYLIQCIAFDASGRLISQYCTQPLTKNLQKAESLFEVLVNNCVFPVHIRDILSDMSFENKQFSYSA